MPRIDRIVTRIGMKARLKQLQHALKVLEDHASKEYKRGYEAGGLAMKRIIEQEKEKA